MSHTVALMSFDFSLWRMNYIMSVTECFSQLWYRCPSLFHFELVHAGSSILTSSLSPNIFSIVFQLTWFSIGFTVIVSYLGSMQAK